VSRDEQPSNRLPRAPRGRRWAAVALAGAAAALVACTDPPGEAAMAEPGRPRFHFTTARNWVNDPNGPVHVDGEYHLFFQHNPNGDVWGDIGWGHAVSEDLVRWEERPMAIPAAGEAMAFSGSAVADSANTSGLCNDEPSCIVAVYTEHSVDAATQVTDQRQNVTVSRDGGSTWTPFPGNPVLDVEAADFRDPNVVWHQPTGRWVMAVALSLERRVLLYGSTDLLTWEPLSSFGPAGATDGIWECPVLVELPLDGGPDTRWVLKVDHNPGHVTGGSGAQYFVGHFDGTTFTPDGPADEIRWLDWGPDFYCAMQFSNEPPPAPGGRTWIAWMSNWDYAATTPTSPWRGAMTVAREIGLRTVGGRPVLVQQPVAALDTYRTDHQRFEAASVSELVGRVEEAAVRGAALDLVLRVEPADLGAVTLRLGGDADEETVISMDTRSAELVVDRRHSGDTSFHPPFAAAFRAPLARRDGPMELRVLVDRTSVEVFADGGAVAITTLVFPAAEHTALSLSFDGGPGGPASLDVWSLGSVGLGTRRA
jgi:fructan beta-fructosidase